MRRMCTQTALMKEHFAVQAPRVLHRICSSMSARNGMASGDGLHVLSKHDRRSGIAEYMMPVVGE